MSDITITFAVLAAVVVLFVLNKLPVEVVAIGSALALYAAGVLDLGEALAGFGDPTVVFIAALFVVSEALDASGVTAWAGRQLLPRVGSSRARLFVLMMGLSALLTALISVNGAVAALVPVVVVLAIRLGRSPSELLLPLAFAAHAGSMLTLTGTPVNVIVSDAAADAGESRFAFLEFALVGVPAVAGAIAIVVAFGHELVPRRRARVMPSDFSAHARTLVEHYGMAERMPLLQRLAEEGRVAPAPAGERPAAETAAAKLVGAEHGVAEVVIPPRSALIGEPAFPGMVTDIGDLVVLAVHRKGRDMGPGETVLAAGDTLLLQGAWDALGAGIEDAAVLAVDAPDLVRRGAAPLGARARPAVVVLVAMVALLATGAVPAAVAGLLAAGAMLVLGVLSVEDAYRGISWTTVVLIAGMIPLTTAIKDTGAGDEIASALLSVIGDSSPHLLLAGLFALTAALGVFISNTATALIVIPIAVSAAAEAGVSVRPVLMTVTLAAAAAFFTPVSTPANMMVMGPAGYRFGDYWRLGLPMLALFALLAIGLVPVIWSF